jgi:hypothetical protein
MEWKESLKICMKINKRNRRSGHSGMVNIGTLGDQAYAPSMPHSGEDLGKLTCLGLLDRSSKSALRTGLDPNKQPELVVSYEVGYLTCDTVGRIW